MARVRYSGGVPDELQIPRAQGSEAEVADPLDAYLGPERGRAEDAAREAAVTA